MERPRAKLPARGLFEWLQSWKTAVSVSGVIVSVEATLRGRREFKRAQRESKEGRIQAAVDRVMEPFSPQKMEAEVAKRGIMDAIRQQILHWDEHATIIAGRFVCGKTMALEDALRGMQGIYVHRVKGKRLGGEAL